MFVMPASIAGVLSRLLGGTGNGRGRLLTVNGVRVRMTIARARGNRLLKECKDHGIGPVGAVDKGAVPGVRQDPQLRVRERLVDLYRMLECYLVAVAGHDEHLGVDLL